MKHYQVICQSVRGASHIQHGTPKQDAAGILRLDGRIVGAVSDGHGDPRCMRSQVGSRLAVDIALALLRDWDPKDANDAHVAALARDIAGRWTRAVEAHFQENPLTEAELANAGNLRAHYAQGRYITHIYGATLIALLRWEDGLLLLQKGDGHAVIIDRNGVMDDQVIPWDERCYLNVTTSLCDADAPDTFTHRLLRGEDLESIAAVLLGSDGVEDSFSDRDLMGAYYGLLAVECAENGEAATEAAMLGDLAEMSRYGSKDDISVAGVIDPELILPLKPVFERMQARGALALRLESTSKRLESMSAAYARREQQLQARQRALEAFQRESAEKARTMEALNEADGASDLLQALQRDLEALQGQIVQGSVDESRMKKRVNAIRAEYEKADRELSAARREYDGQRDRRDYPCPDFSDFTVNEPGNFLLDRLFFQDGDFEWQGDRFFCTARERMDWQKQTRRLEQRLNEKEKAFNEQACRLRRAEQKLEECQRRTHRLEESRLKLLDACEDARSARRFRIERQRRALEAELEQRAEEEARLKRAAEEALAEFTVYKAKYDAAKDERDQLLAEIGRLN